MIYVITLLNLILTFLLAFVGGRFNKQLGAWRMPVILGFLVVSTIEIVLLIVSVITFVSSQL